MKVFGPTVKRITLFTVVVALVLSWAQTSSAASLVQVSLVQSQPEPAASGNTYAFSMSNQSATALGCLTVQFNTAPDASGFTPNGFDAGNASFGGSFMSSWSGWTAGNSTGVAKVTRSGAVAPDASATTSLTVSGITNGTAANTSEYAIIHTYSDASCTAVVNQTAVAFTWTGDSAVSTVIDPALTFSVTALNDGQCNGAAITGVGSTSTAISLGTVNKTSRAIGGQQLSVATNAGGGASVYAHVDGPLSDGHGHSIASIGADSNNPAAFPNPGTEAFGYTIDSQLSQGAPDRFTANGPNWASINGNDREVLYSPYSAAPISGCLAYQITISKDTVGGFYGDNVTYTAVPAF